MAEGNTRQPLRGQKQQKPGTFGLIRQKFKYGLVWYSIRNILARYGLDIQAYYWVIEGKNSVTTPVPKDKKPTYRLRFLREDELGVLNQIRGVDVSHIQNQIRQGAECIGLLADNAIVAVMFIEFGTILFMKRKYTLKGNEAYLSNMYTFNAYRGKNLAPYLRYRSYQLLNERGYDTFYSVSDFLNKSSVRFKEKLGAQHQALYVYLGLGKKFKWNFLIKEYHQQYKTSARPQ